jgi:hypothetical protein
VIATGPPPDCANIGNAATPVASQSPCPTPVPPPPCPGRHPSSSAPRRRWPLILCSCPSSSHCSHACPPCPDLCCPDASSSLPQHRHLLILHVHPSSIRSPHACSSSTPRPVPPRCILLLTMTSAAAPPPRASMPATARPLLLNLFNCRSFLTTES